MKNISAWAIRHPLPPIVLFVVLLFMGIVCFVRLPVTADPDISFPGVFIGIGQPGAAPQELETQVMQKVEGAVAGIGNIDNITSWAVEGQANIFIQFEIGTPIDRAVADVRDAVAKVRVLLPQGIQEPTVQRINADGGPMVLYAVSSSSLTEEELSWFVDNTITKRLLQVTGVAQVQRGGGVNREIRVELDPARMQALGITAVEVNEQLRTLNLDSPGGRAQVGGGEQAIRVLGGARTAAALGASQIALSGGRFARLSDLAEVRDSVGEIRSIARLDGRPATTFSVIKAKGYSDVSTDNGIQAELAKIRKENPHVTLTQVYTSVDYTKETYHSALSALVEGSVLAVLVVFLFLRNVRATLISALAIPMSAIPAFAFMQWMDFTLNSISLLALSLVAGVLVDDAIVEIENIVRHMRMGKSGFQAALEAADQIGLAVVATSATIIAVFVPVGFMVGLTGQYFKQFGLTVPRAVFFSLLVSRLITPVVAAYTLKSDNVARHTDGPIMAWYQRLLGWCAVHRWKTVLAGLGFMVLSAAGVALCSFSFIPESDVGTSFLSVELPPGVRLEDTARVTAAAYRIIARQPEVRDIVESVGTSDEGVRQAELDIALLPASERSVTQRQFEDRVTQELKVIPDAQLHFNRNGNGRDVNIYITGDDPQLTYNTARRVVEEMSKLSFVRDARINNDLPRPEILVHPHLDLASARRDGRANQRDHPHRDPRGPGSEQRQVLAVGSAGADPRQPAGGEPQEPGDAGEPAGAHHRRRDRTPEGGRRHQFRRGSHAGAPLQPEPPPVHRCGPQGRRARGCDEGHLQAADAQAPAAGGAPGRDRRCQVHERADRQFLHRHGHRHPDGVRGAGAAVRTGAAADHHPVLAAAVDRWGGIRAADHRTLDLPRGDDRVPDAHGHRRQELDPAGGLRHRGDARRQ